MIANNFLLFLYHEEKVDTRLSTCLPLTSMGSLFNKQGMFR